MIMDTQFTAVRGMLQAMEHGIDQRFDAVDKSNGIRNGRIEKMECETRIVRWFEKNPSKTIIIAILFVAAIIFAWTVIDIKETICKQGIELKK